MLLFILHNICEVRMIIQVYFDYGTSPPLIPAAFQQPLKSLRLG